MFAAFLGLQAVASRAGGARDPRAVLVLLTSPFSLFFLFSRAFRALTFMSAPPSSPSPQRRVPGGQHGAPKVRGGVPSPAGRQPPCSGLCVQIPAPVHRARGGGE